MYGLSTNIEVANCTFTKTTIIGLYVDEYDNGNGYDIHDNNFDLGSEGIYYGFFAADFKVSGVSFIKTQSTMPKVVWYSPTKHLTILVIVMRTKFTI